MSKTADVVAATLLVVGGLNWGLVGLLNFDLVATVAGPMSVVSRLVYTLVGLSAAFLAVRWGTVQRRLSAAGI